jgi:hypothetical protein
MTYKASLDNFAKAVTIAVTVLFAIIISTQFSIINKAGSTIPIFTIATLVFIYIIVFAFRPINYKLFDNKLIINRLIANVEIDRAQIKSVVLLNKEKMGWVVRTFGVGGLFGYYGRFSNTKIGVMTWYATRKNKTVLVTLLNNKKIIVTPDEPEKFVADFLK